MKNLLFFLVMLFISFVGFNQVIDVTFNEHLKFTNPVNSTDFFTIMNKDTISVKSLRFGENKYVINLDKKTINFYFLGNLQKTGTIKSINHKNGIILLTVNDIDSFSGEPMLVYMAINRNTEKNDYPYFTFFFESEGITHGFMTIDN